jgi:hypothetical protein
LPINLWRCLVSHGIRPRRKNLAPSKADYCPLDGSVPVAAKTIKAMALIAARSRVSAWRPEMARSVNRGEGRAMPE